MEDKAFLERLKSLEIAHTDQGEARDEAANEQERINTLIRSSAKAAFDGIRSHAEALVQQANARLSEPFNVFPGAGGFVIGLGNRTAGFTYATPTFANIGCPKVIVTFQSLASNFGFLGGPFEDDGGVSDETWVLEPCWDTDSDSLKWQGDNSVYSSDDVARRAMEYLMRRQG